MSALATAASVALSVLYTPFLLFILCIIFLASIGKSLGVRRLYVDILLKLFEYGRQHIEVAKLIKRTDSSSEDDDDDECSGDRPPSAAVRARRPNGINGVSKATVIKRDEILAPDPELNYKRTASQERLGARSPPPPPAPLDGDAAAAADADVVPVTETQPDFDLSVCLELVKAGMEAIIEDQVTLVFEAEELRSWNLLTRTNRQYEFITWRLTVIWMMGFLVRYFFLLPLRILICFIGIVTTLTLTMAVSVLPPSRFKRFIGALCFKISFRCLIRGTSCQITYHDLQYAPKGNGFCVANHTSPIDVAILASQNCFTLVWWLIICTALVGCLPDGSFKRRANFSVSVMCFEMLSRSLSAVITYHHPENRPRTGICVANHTSPIDVLVLMCDNCYALIGQSHGGFLGLLQRALARASPHIWFERSEVKDRSLVARRLKEHISEPNNPPILIFPEGTCINNTSVMQFKKGSFEVGGTIYPVAIKYDARFGDAFWNSSRYGMLQYLYMMMSSWAIVCDVWYLPPMRRAAHESAIEFANRVKAVIARRGGLVDLMWDGQLKRIKPKKEWKELQQEEVSRRLKGE